MKYILREIDKTEYPLLDEFLYGAIFVPDGAQPPPRSIIGSPEMQVYVAQLGQREGDHCFVADRGGHIVGAVWARIMDDYGHVDEHTPSLAISVAPAYRGQGIGTALIKKMCTALQATGYAQLSLSVQKANRAATLYTQLGFKTIRETQDEYIMVRDLRP